MKRTAKLIALTVCTSILIASGNLFSQTLNEAGEKFNEGVELTKAENYDGAVTAFESCISICDQVGPEGADLKSRAVSQIPDLHYKAGVALYKGKKITESITRLKKASLLAKEYGDDETLAKSNKLLPQLINAVGLSHYKKDDFDNAITSFDEAISYDIDYAKPYLGKALALNKKNDFEGMQEALVLAIEKGEAANDTKTVETAKELGYKSFFVRGQKALQASNFDEAQRLFTKALSYGEGDANLYYLLSVTYNKLSQWDMTLEQAGKAIAMEESPEKQAAIYFEMGTAYEKKGDTENACASYRKALTGANGAAAKYQMEQVLKCQ